MLCGCRFTSECHLDTDGEVTCIGCPEGYTGRRCQRCAEGYEGDPTVPGGSCRFIGHALPTPRFFFTILIPAKAREYVFTGVGLCVCVSVCDHDN